MEGAPLSLILDVIILVLLGLTIVYAARLSLQLRRLRDSKSDLDKVVRELIKNLDRADRSIAGLKQAARESGTELQDAVDKAMAISDELQMITDSGDRLAARLEHLTDVVRPVVAGTPAPVKASPPPAAKPVQPNMTNANAPSTYAQQLRKLDAAEEKAASATFAIRDPDAERGQDPRAAAVEDDSLYSEAERDLFRAMKGRTAR